MLCGALASCKKEKEPEETEQQSSEVVTIGETETEMITNEWGEQAFENPIPEELHYNGLEVNILVRDSERYFREFMKDDHSQSLDSQIYTRNMKIQKDLGVILKLNKGPNLVGGGQNLVDFNQMIETSILQGDGSIDVIAHYALYGVAHGIRAYFSDLTDESFTYLNLDRPYWNQNYQSVARLNSGLYYAVGDANLSVYDRMIVLHYNETMGEKYGLPDLYKMVLDGDWTYDELLKIIRDTADYQDDSTQGKSEGDTVGLVSCAHSEATDPYLSAFDLPMLNNTDGIYSWNISGNEKLQNATEKLKTLFHQPAAYLCPDTGVSYRMFTAGRALFNQDIMYREDAILTAYGEMSDDRGILPLPKYDADQPNYQCAAQTAYNIMCVPDSDSVDREAISAVLEAMNYESYNSVRPYYFMYIAQARYVENSASVKIFDLILNSAHFDTATVFDNMFWKSTTNTVGSPVYMFRNACLEANDCIGHLAQTLGNAWASTQSQMNNNLNDFQFWASKTN